MYNSICKLTRYALLVFARSCSSVNNKIISLKNLFHHSQLGAPQKEKKIRGPWARAQCAHWLRRSCVASAVNDTVVRCPETTSFCRTKKAATDRCMRRRAGELHSCAGRNNVFTRLRAAPGSGGDRVSHTSVRQSVSQSSRMHLFFCRRGRAFCRLPPPPPPSY